MVTAMKPNDTPSVEGTEAEEPSRSNGRPPVSWWRRAVFGDPLATHQAHHQRLPKYLALPVFSSDAISSVAYATEEILLALTLTSGVAASVALGNVFPISAAIAVLLAIVVFSYRQTIFA